MSADLFSNFLGMTLQATGNNNNAWGTILNGSALAIMERAIAGNISHAVTGGTLALDTTVPPAGQTPALDLIQIFTGTLTSKQIVQMPNVSKFWYVYNGTTGAFPLHVKTASGTPVQVAQGTGKIILCDGNNNMLRLDRDMVGRFVHSGSSNNPDTLPCNGASLLRTDYPDLFAQIGTTFGSADSVHFTVPLLTDTGRFLRSASASVTLGTAQSNQNLAHTHTMSGAPSVGSLSTDTQGSHTHGASSSDSGHGHAGSTVGGGPNAGGSAVLTVSANTLTTQIANVTIATGFAVISTSISSAGSHSHNVTGAPGAGSLAAASSGGTEARPESLSVYVGIIY